MAIKKTDIYRSLWDSCDQLRGGMDASLYKDYILTLLFVKYVSDRAGQSDSLIYVPEGCTFEDMRKLRGNKNIGEEIDKIIAKIAEANDLSGVIDRAFFNDTEKFGKGEKMVRTLTALINIFSRQELDFSRNRAGGDDILGDAYEYLMRNFATESGKSKGQFYTPAEVSRVLASVSGVERAERVKQSVYDPTCGSGSLLLKAAEAAPVSLSVFGQEKDITTRGLAVMNMILHGKETADIRQGDTLADPEFTNPDGSLQTFDFVVANPPFSDKAWGEGINPEADRFDRFADGVPPAKNGDFAYLLHILSSMKATGSGAVILPHGVLFRGNKEAELREKVLKRGYIKAIIGLPANLFYGTSIEASVVVLDKSAATPERAVFIIDAKRGFSKDGNKNRLRERDIHKIIDAFARQAELPGFSRLVPFDEIQRNDFSLNISRYIDGSDPEDLQDIEAHLKGGVPNRDIDLLQDFWTVMPGIRKALFGPNERPGYSDPLVEPENVRATIRNHADFVAYRNRVRAILQGWIDANRPLMRAFDQGAKPSEFIHKIAEDMLTRFAEAPLIDQYEAYQRLMTYWQETMQDDAFIIADAGWEAAKELREARKEVDGNKTKWLEEADLTVNKVRLVADVIPPALIVARFFPELQKALDEAQTQADAIAAEIDELVEEHGADDGLLSDALSDTGKLTKGTLKDRIGSGKADAEELAILKQAKKLMDAETTAKKAVKDADEALTEATLKKYPELTEDEIRVLVVDDKWLADIAEFIDAEIEARTEKLTARVRVLTERYGHTLLEITSDMNELSSLVEAHLAAMGFQA